MAELRGTFFSVGEPYVTKSYLHKAQDAIAEDTERRIHLLQAQRFRHPTGYYERHIVNRDLSSQHVITDSDVVYGPWLEGVGSRNFPVTRFKGYAIFRQVTDTARPIQLAQQAIREMCRAFNA